MASMSIPMQADRTALPSFSDLLASISRPASTPPSPSHHPRLLPANQPSTTMRSHQQQQQNHRDTSKTTPSTHRGRPRSMTAPSLPTFAPHPRPRSPHHTYAHRPALLPQHHHSLPPPRMHRTTSGSYEHFADRIEALRQGDGVWDQVDACAVDLVPAHARPQHTYYPTAGSSPPRLSPHAHTLPRVVPVPTDSPSSAAPSPDTHRASATSPPTYLEHPHLHHQHSLGSHSPLSTNSPLTPVSFYGLLDERDKRDKREKREKRDKLGLSLNGDAEEEDVVFQGRQQGQWVGAGVRVPRLPRMR